MKHTNITAPRTMAECQFRASDDPIEAFRPDRRVSDAAVSIALALGAVVALLVGWLA